MLTRLPHLFWSILGLDMKIANVTNVTSNCANKDFVNKTATTHTPLVLITVAV